MEVIFDSNVPPTLYIIAGPPGIGKSTNAQIFIPNQVNILNHDGIETEYKKMGILEYEEQANQKMWSLIQANIALNIDFGIELNLGYASHYGGLKKIHGLCEHYEIYVILFFTDSESLCLNRAAQRGRSGGHRVEPTVVEDMR